jgi:hypothetical protein
MLRNEFIWESGRKMSARFAPPTLAVAELKGQRFGSADMWRVVRDMSFFSGTVRETVPKKKDEMMDSES